jgi:hypothetical protein
MEGSDLSIQPVPGPHRVGVKRNFDVNDYKALVDVGKAVGVRIQCLFILSEMDRQNLLAKYPTTTYLREKWDNSSRITNLQQDIIDYVREQGAYMEFGMHGTGHEYWPEQGKRRRAEWYNREDKHPWPEETIRQHIQCFKDIMAQYGISEENGHSFPETFVPCSYSYYWNPAGDYSLGKLLSAFGVKYANTDFSHIPELLPPQGTNSGGFDHGVMVINRLNYGNEWYRLNALPEVPVDKQETDIIESHWPNWLAQDEFLQPEVTRQWIDYYRRIQQKEDRYLAKNTEQLHAQWLYKKYTIIREQIPGSAENDNTAMPDEVYQRDILGTLVLKVRLNVGEHIS